MEVKRVDGGEKMVIFVLKLVYIDIDLVVCSV